MTMNNTPSIRLISHRIAHRLALAGLMGTLAVAGISTASAQSTTGSIFGRAPAGSTITVHSDTTGTGRTAKVNANGRYLVHPLQTGTYTVTLKQNGQAIAKHINVPVIVSRGSEVDFKCGEIKCGAMAAAK